MWADGSIYEGFFLNDMACGNLFYFYFFEGRGGESWGEIWNNLFF